MKCHCDRATALQLHQCSSVQFSSELAVQLAEDAKDPRDRTGQVRTGRDRTGRAGAKGRPKGLALCPDDTFTRTAAAAALPHVLGIVTNGFSHEIPRISSSVIAHAKSECECGCIWRHSAPQKCRNDRFD